MIKITIPSEYDGDTYSGESDVLYFAFEEENIHKNENLKTLVEGVIKEIRKIKIIYNDDELTVDECLHAIKYGLVIEIITTPIFSTYTNGDLIGIKNVLQNAIQTGAPFESIIKMVCIHQKISDDLREMRSFASDVKNMIIAEAEMQLGKEQS
jgi:hypothetical protein